MKSTDVFPSRYLKAEEIDEDVTLTISSVVLETLKNKQGQDEPKPIMYFEEIDKGLVINKTNWGVCAKQYGDESDNWANKPVTLTVVDVDAFGDVVSAIRIKAPRKVAANPIRTATKPVAVKPAPVPVTAHDFDPIDEEPHGKADELLF